MIYFLQSSTIFCINYENIFNCDIQFGSYDLMILKKAISNF